MEEVLILILQAVVEIFLNAGLPWPAEAAQNPKKPERDKILGICFLWFCGGLVVGLVSLAVLPRSLVATPELRILTLVAAPVLSGSVAHAIATRRARSNANISPGNHFWQSFWCALGIVIIRFSYVSRV